MRKLIVSLNISLDGCIAGPDDELDWHFKNWTPELTILLCEQLSYADTIVLGRITYLQLAGYWSGVVNDLRFPREDYPLADMMNRYQKIVFSQTITKPVWNNSYVINAVAEKELARLKCEQGKDMMVLGSGQLVQSLISAGLIDELILWIHPVVLKKGRLLFTTMSGNFLLHLKGTRHTDSGVIILLYEVAHSAA
jgi:dihydrofolate reductase